MAGLLEELKRRKVLKVGAGYLVAAWLAVQAATEAKISEVDAARMKRLRMGRVLWLRGV